MKKAEYIIGTASMLGEGAIWDYRKQVLYWVDTENKCFFMFDPVSGKNLRFDLPMKVGTLVPETENSVIVALQNGIYRKNTLIGSLEFLGRPESLRKVERFNDGKCDAEGRLWVGTIAIEEEKGGSFLYRFDRKGFKEMVDSISISNGIIWNSRNDRMYYIDTPTQKVIGFDFNLKSGEISNPSTAVIIPEELGFPDGMTIDAEDKIWVAMWNGSAIYRFDPESGEMLEKIEVPALNVTSVAFGGTEMDTLYITSAGISMNEKESSMYPHAGGLFKFVPGVKGIKANYFGIE